MRRMERHMNRQTDRETGRQTDRQTYIDPEQEYKYFVGSGLLLSVKCAQSKFSLFLDFQ